MNYPKMDPVEVQKRISEGRKHLKLMVSLYRDQLRRKRHFIHEHPKSASSWHEVGIQSISQDPAVSLVTADQCMYWLVTPDSEGKPMPAKKPTTFMTSSRQMADLLTRRCDGKHQHQPLVSGRCKNAAFYPLKLVHTILQGIRNTKDAEDALREAGNSERDMINFINGFVDNSPVIDKKIPTSQIPKVAGGHMTVTYNPNNFRTKYVDEYTGEALDQSLISDAIIEELNYFNSKVWVLESNANVLNKPGHVCTE